MVYQESKIFHFETFLVNVFDNTLKKTVTFEIYGLDTQDLLSLSYNYMEFDALFRFNAELMNPNRKEGRFHWVIERLAVETIGKDRKLRLKPDPSEEQPQHLLFDDRKIPTGRMDLKERSRLRQQMDMLESKRSEAIDKKKQIAHEHFIKSVNKMKEDHARAKEELDIKIAKEREERVKLKEAAIEEQLQVEQQKQVKIKARRKKVDAIEVRIREQREENYKQLRSKWRSREVEELKELQEFRARQAVDARERAETRLRLKQRLLEIQNKREVAWAGREERLRRKETETLRKVLEVKAERQRLDKMRKEREQEFIQLIHNNRQPIFKAQMERSEKRKEAWEREEEETKKWHEQRAVPKKKKTKGRNADSSAAAAGAKVKDKKKQMDTGALLSAVEEKIRAEMQEQQRRAALERKRAELNAQRTKVREEGVNHHMAQIRQKKRTEEEQEALEASTRTIVRNSKKEEQQEAERQKALALQKLNKVREMNIKLREQSKLAAAAAVTA